MKDCKTFAEACEWVVTCTMEETYDGLNDAQKLRLAGFWFREQSTADKTEYAINGDNTDRAMNNLAQMLITRLDAWGLFVVGALAENVLIAGEQACRDGIERERERFKQERKEAV